MIIAAFVCFTAFNLFMVCFGLYSILLTVNVYLLGALLLWYVPGWLIKDPQRSVNVRMVLVSLMVSLLGAEFILRYVTESNLSYAEANDELFYASVYRRADILPMTDMVSGLFAPVEQKVPPVLNEPNSTLTPFKKEFSYVYRYNSLGLRGPEPTVDTNRITMVMLGDSFTEGVGVPEDSSWVCLLEDRLNAGNLFPKKVQCINGGLAGSDVIFEFEILQKHLLSFDPAYVMLSINSSDLIDIMVKGGKERFTEKDYLRHSNAPWWESVYLTSHIVRAVVIQLGHYDWMLHSPAQQKVARNAAMEVIKQSILTDYLPLSVRENFRLMVVLHPVQYELENDAFPLGGLASDTELTDAVRVINLHPQFKQWQREQDVPYASLFWPIDHHHNSEGYGLMAKMLADPAYY